MYSVKLDENNYFTGSYAEIGSIEGGIDIQKLPPDMTKMTCYRFDNNDWEYDEERWKQIQNEIILTNIYQQRKEAFPLIDKYQLTLVYKSLTSEQKIELADYRQAWLDAPNMLAIPKIPAWMV